MDHHFHLDGPVENPEPHSAFIVKKGERIGVWAAGIVAIGLATAVALGLVALGIAAVRWAL